MKKLMLKLALPFRWILTHFDRQDVGLLIGLGLLSYGIYIKDPAWAFIVAGALVLCLSYVGHAAELIRGKKP